MASADVADAVRFAQAEGLDICIRGGGHNVAGRAVVDEALMIDLSPMKGIHVDPDARTVRAQGGVPAVLPKAGYRLREASCGAS